MERVIPISACAGRTGYPGLSAARAAAQSLNKRPGHPVHPYRCYLCGHYHVGVDRGRRPVPVSRRLTPVYIRPQGRVELTCDGNCGSLPCRVCDGPETQNLILDKN